MPKRTNLKDETYYWVRRKPIRKDNGASDHPHWEPMLHDKGRFYARSADIENVPGIRPQDLDAIGAPIERRAPRTTRKLWMPTTVDYAAERALPNPHLLRPSRSAAASFGNGLPVPVEISWENADFNLANGYARIQAKK
jgi:hypothetical protein